MKEKRLQNEILRAFGTKRWMRLWRANTGVAQIGSRVVRFGVPGQADLTGILQLGGIGVSLWIEVKSASGRQTQEQVWFQQMVERLGGLYILARSVEDVDDAINAYRRRCRAVLGTGEQDGRVLGMDGQARPGWLRHVLGRRKKP